MSNVNDERIRSQYDKTKMWNQNPASQVIASHWVKNTEKFQHDPARLKPVDALSTKP